MLEGERWLCRCGDHYLSCDEFSLSSYERSAAKSNEQHGGSVRLCNTVRFGVTARRCCAIGGRECWRYGAERSAASAWSAVSNMRI